MGLDGSSLPERPFSKSRVKKEKRKAIKAKLKERREEAKSDAERGLDEDNLDADREGC